MIISESGLAKAMKAAYKGGGYTVANITGAMSIWTDEWCVRCAQRNMPRKVLATIVEHAGELPEADCAMYLHKGDDPQWANQDYAVSELADWWTPTGQQEKAYMAPLVFTGLIVYQSSSRKCYAIDPLCLAILDRGIAEQQPVQIDSRGKAVVTQDDQQVCIQMDFPAEMYAGVSWVADAWAAIETVRLREK